MAQAKTQFDQRRSFNALDQFGRSWLVNIEIASGAPTGIIQPAGWHDPLRTPQKYIKVRNAFGIQTAESPVSINFDQWITDQKENAEGWKRQYYAIGQKMYQSKFDPRVQDDDYLLTLTGPKPWPSVEVLLKARAGHRGMLGLEPLNREARKALGMDTLDDLEAEMNEAMAQDEIAAPDLATYPPKLSWQEFLKYAREHGHAATTTEAAPLWNQYKQRQEA